MSSEDKLLRLLRTRAEAMWRERSGHGGSVDLDQIVGRVIADCGEIIDISETRKALVEKLRAMLAELFAGERRSHGS